MNEYREFLVKAVCAQPNNAELAQEFAKIDDACRSIRKATAMPARGEFFVVPDPHLNGGATLPYQRWNDMATVCIVSNPDFGHAVRITADNDSEIRISIIDSGPGSPGFFSSCVREELEFRAGDLLEYHGSGSGRHKVGDAIVLSRDSGLFRHAPGPFEQAVDRLANYGQPISGRVVSVEPMCSALICLPPHVQSIEDARAEECQLTSFALRDIFLPVHPQLKAASKKK